MINRWCAVLASMILLAAGCSPANEEAREESEPPRSPLAYSFFVAGHVYGNPESPQIGLYPPFVQQAPFLNDYEGMALGVLTGDVVFKSTPEYWDGAQADMQQFDMPLYIAPGNHDRGLLFRDRFKKDYFSFRHSGDLFIVLSPTEWNIGTTQLKFLTGALSDNSDAGNIFIFVHELIWWEPDNQYRNVEINYRGHYPGSTNFWNVVVPLLTSLPQQIVLFAGDLGADDTVTPYMYDRHENLTFIASGMGGGRNDNLIITKVAVDGSFSFELVAMTGERDRLGILTDHRLP